MESRVAFCHYCSTHKPENDFAWLNSRASTGQCKTCKMLYSRQANRGLHKSEMVFSDQGQDPDKLVPKKYQTVVIPERYNGHHKVCNMCGVNKDVHEFSYLHKVDCFQSYCKPCTCLRSKEYYKNKKQQALQG